MGTFLTQLENGFHLVLPEVEAGVTHILAKEGNRVVLHRLVGAAEAVTSLVNVPMLTLILQALNQAIPA